MVQFNLELELEIKKQNPWWTGDKGMKLPHFKRWPFKKLQARLQKPIAPILVLKGTRQVGKSTLQLQLIEDLLAKGVPAEHIFRFQFDETKSIRALSKFEPILEIVHWYETHVLKDKINNLAHNNARIFIFLDEVQNLNDWDIQLKTLVDRTSVTIIVTGSSALRIASARDSLAGRIQMLEIGPLRLREIAELVEIGNIENFDTDNGFESWLNIEFWHKLNDKAESNGDIRDKAFAVFAERGGYPLAQHLDVGWSEIAEQLRETVVERVIRHDLRIGERGRRRDEALLKEIYNLACGYMGRTPTIAHLTTLVKSSLDANIGTQRVRSYLEFLDGALLLRMIEGLGIWNKKKKPAAKICLSDHAVRAAWIGETTPLLPSELVSVDESNSAKAGYIVESIVGYYLSSLGLDMHHKPARLKPSELEVDFIMSIGIKRIPIEVKYSRNIHKNNTLGLVQFLDKNSNNAQIGIIVTQEQTTIENIDPRIVAIPLKNLLLVR